MKTGNSKHILWFLGAAASIWLSGCAAFPEKLEQEYQFQERASFAVKAQDAFADAFAKDLCVVSIDGNAGTDDMVTAEAAALFDLQNKEVRYAKNALEQMYPASITKVMTALLAVKYGDLSDVVTVSDEVSKITEAGATMCGIKPGDRISMEELLYGLMLPSGNDAGVAIAMHMDGSVEAFANRMNAEAKRLGATGSHFENPHGLHSENHYTTVYDLYLIFQEALKYPKFRDVIHTATHTAKYVSASGEEKQPVWQNSNWFLNGKKEPPQGVNVLGGKTGTTKAAGNCLMMGALDEEDHEYVSIVLKADSRSGLYENMYHLVDKIVN